MQNPDPDTLSAWTALWWRTGTSSRGLDAQLRAGAGMSLDEYDVLFQLRRAGQPLAMSELADHV